MNKQLLIALQKRNKQRLTDLRAKIEDPETREDELAEIKDEIDTITEELQSVADSLSELDDEDEDGDGTADDEPEDGDGTADDENRSADDEKRSAVSEQRSAAMAAVRDALSTRAAEPKKRNQAEIRSAFAKFVVGQISESEARALGIEAGNGSVTVPEVIASEIITYAQEENLLRKYGTVVRTAGDVKYPVLVKKAEGNVNKKERTTEILETSIEFDEILLDPAEFDALATVTKKLLAMSGA
ncbi:phage major capsid protein, partial [Pseudolactococcus chungangensis]